MKSVHVVASSPVVKTGLEALICANPALELAFESAAAEIVVIETTGGEDARAHIAPYIEPGNRAPALVVLAGEIEEPWLFAALRLNLRAVIGRDAAPDAIACAIEAAANGFVVLEHAALERIAPAAVLARTESPQRPGDGTLTPRETQVLNMLAEGVGNKTIAARMAISEHTVKFHIASIFSKLGAQSRTEAVTLGARAGLVML